MKVYVVEEVVDGFPIMRQVFKSHYAATRYIKRLDIDAAVIPYMLLDDVGKAITCRTFTIDGDSRSTVYRHHFRKGTVTVEMYPQLSVQWHDDGVEIRLSVLTPKPRSDYWWISRYSVIMRSLLSTAERDKRNDEDVEVIEANLMKELAKLERIHIVEYPKSHLRGVDKLVSV